MHFGLSGYVVGVVSLAILTLAVDVTNVPADIPSRSPFTLIALLAITMVAEHISFRVHRGWISAAATLPHLAAALLFQPAQAELIGLLGAASYGLSRRQALPKVVFNAAVVGLAVGAAAHVALALGGPRLIEGGVGWIGPLVAVLASLTYYLVSVATVSVAVALDERTVAWPLARHKLGFLALADLGLGLTGAVLAVLLTSAVAWAPALVLPAVLVYLVKRSHERLAASEARLKTIIDSAMDAIITIDAKRRIVVFNRAAEAMFGYPGSRALTKNVDMVLVGASDDPMQDSGVVKDGSLLSLAQGRRASGEVFPVEMTFTDLEVQGERLSTLVVRDISARRRAEDERALLLVREHSARIAAEHATELRDEFLQMAAHELRTPITSLHGYAQLMRQRLDASEFEPRILRRAAEVVDQQSGKLARLVSLLLDVSAIQTDRLEVNFQVVDLAALVSRGVTAAQSEAHRHTIALDSPATLMLAVDPQRLQQVLNNLLENAIRFSPHGGTIEVSLTHPDPGSVWLEVRDYGLGVSPEHRSHLFDRFYRAHSDSHMSGLGLGLHVTRHIVERHGGTIDVVIPPSGGTRFVVRLPGPSLGAQTDTPIKVVSDAA
ncbi:MAG: PAS domain-containing sensor histidine kinase [Chloroflexota bacterium]|nr:PAS domain-containing sensor histidine kinase [Chloroflexota bacterium]